MTEDETPSRETDCVLETEHLTRTVSGVIIVDDISVKVCEGDVLAIVGPSGSGKSSFLRLLNRLDEPTGGKVFIKGKDYRQIPPRELRQRVGMLMQASNLFPGTVRENIQFGPQQRGEQVSEQQIDELLECVGLSGYKGRNVARLSGGEAQRVSLARTLANSPEMLLLDEPTSALDETAKDDAERLIFRLVRERNLTCLIVTHDPDQAARVADRVMMVESGRLLRIGSVEEVLHA
jgi:putative ABC transport system ATP-binding protein